MKGPDSRWVHSLKLTLHVLRLAAFALSLLFLLFLFHLLTFGLPESLIQTITTQFRANNIHLAVDSIRLSPRHGWVFKNARIYSPDPNELQPLLHTENLYLFLWPDDWTALSTTAWNLTLSGKQFNLSMGHFWETSLRNAHPFRTITQLNATLHLEKSRLSLIHSELTWGDLHLSSSGKIIFPSVSPASPSENTFYPLFQSRVLQTVNALEKVTFETPPQINITFNIQTDAPKQTTADASFIANGIRFKENRYNHLNGKLSLKEGQINIESLGLTQTPDQQLSASGFWNTEYPLVQLKIKNTLAGPQLIGLLPNLLKINLAQTGVAITGPVDFEATLGPASPQKLLEQIQLTVQKAHLSYKHLNVSPLQLTLTRDGDQIQIDSIHALINGSPLTGTFDMNLADQSWSTSVETTARPRPIGPLTTPELEEFINRFEFPTSLPTIKAQLTYNGTPGSITMNGTLSGRDFFIAGIPIDSLQTAMMLSNSVLHLPDLQIAHEEKKFEGDIQIDFDDQLVVFDASSHFSPDVIAHALAPNHPTILTNFTFSGAVTSSGSGLIDLSGGDRHEFKAVLRASAVSTAGLDAYQFNGQMEGRKGQLFFTQSSMQLFDGLVEGAATFDLDLHNDQDLYYMELTAKKIQIEKFKTHEASGLLSGNIYFAADAKTPFWDSCNGAGSITIEEGQLHDLPILRGFTRLIRTTAPAFSLFSMTTLHADYTLRDGGLQSENLQLGGSLLSAQARGSYSPSQGLDVTVRAAPLRQTHELKEWYKIHLWAAATLQAGTAPLFYLFEFTLDGTLDDPQWHMNAIPNDLLSIFRKEESLEETAPETNPPHIE